MTKAQLKKKILKSCKSKKWLGEKNYDNCEFTKLSHKQKWGTRKMCGCDGDDGNVYFALPFYKHLKKTYGRDIIDADYNINFNLLENKKKPIKKSKKK